MNISSETKHGQAVAWPVAPIKDLAADRGPGVHDGSPARCSAAEGGGFFGESENAVSATLEAGRVHFRTEKFFERGQPRLWRGQAVGRGSFGTFLAAKKSTLIKKEGDNFLRELPWIKFDLDKQDKNIPS